MGQVSIRAKLNGIETDAFSKRARRWLRWRAGQKHWAKSHFWRKVRMRARSY